MPTSVQGNIQNLALGCEVTLLIACMLLENVLGQPTCTALGTVSKRMGQGLPRVGDEVYIHLVSGGRTRFPLKYCVLCCSSVQGRDPGMFYSLVEM